METEREKVLETLAEAEMIQGGEFGELLAIRQYHQTSLTRKCVVVAYRETGGDDGFILTAYLTTEPSRRREMLWKR